MTQNRSLLPAPPRRRRPLVRWLLGALLSGAVVCSAGCGSTSQSQVTRLQAEKKELLNRIVDEQKRSETLTAELRDANLRAAEAEKQLARVFDDPRGRFVGGGSNSTIPYSSAFRATGASNAGSTSAGPMSAGSVGTRPADIDAPPVRPQIGLGAPRDTSREHRSNSDHSSSSSEAPRSFSGRGFADSYDGPEVDLSGPRNGAASPGWMPKSR